MTKVLAIDGSYRDGGVTDQVVDVMAESLRNSGAEVEVVFLRDYPIEFCLNCRECTQQPGEAPGKCVLQDGMQGLIDKIEDSDALILASPTNFGAVTALFKRFMERLIVYGYWPWGQNSPKNRKVDAPKKEAILISSCGAPGFFGRWLFGTHKQLKTATEVIGAQAVGTLFTGYAAKKTDYRLPEKLKEKARVLAERLHQAQ